MRQDFNDEQYQKALKTLLAHEGLTDKDRVQIEFWLDLFSVKPHYTICMAEAYKYGIFVERLSRVETALGRELDRLFWLTIQQHDGRYLYDDQHNIIKRL